MSRLHTLRRFILFVAVPTLSVYTSDQPGLVTSTFPISARGQTSVHPRMSGRIVVWAQPAATASPSPVPAYGVFTQSLSTHRRTRIVASSAVIDASSQLAISGVTIVWADCRRCRRVNGLPGYDNTRVYAESLSTHHAFLVSALPGDQSAPAVSGRLVAWLQTAGSGQTAIYARDLSSPHPVLVAGGHAVKSSPAVSGQVVLWNERVEGGWDVVGMNLATHIRFVVARHAGPGNDLLPPVISGHTVVWTSRWYRRQTDSIEGKDLRTGRAIPIATLPPSSSNQGTGPAVAMSGSIVVWQQRGAAGRKANASWAIYARDLPTARTLLVAAGQADNTAPDVSGSIVVWERNWPRSPGSGSMIYGAKPGKP